MNILHVHVSDIALGGGAIAMLRLHEGLRQNGVGSKILCANRTRGSADSVKIPPLPRLEFQLGRVTRRLGSNDLHRVSSFTIRRLDAYREADILNLHCIHGGFFNYLALPWLTATKPAVFTLHDMWPLTGHCASSYDCERWKTGCGRCPYPENYPPIPTSAAIGNVIWRRISRAVGSSSARVPSDRTTTYRRKDGTHLEWRLKKWAYSRSNMIVVAPCRWMKGHVEQSMLGGLPAHHIPHGVDIHTFAPLDKRTCRSRLGLPFDKYVVLFVSARLTDRPKGGDLLLKALDLLPPTLKTDTVLLRVGEVGDSTIAAGGIETVDLGYLTDDRTKAVAYSAADLFVFPTRADNAPLVLLESLACGTPIVSFRVGGVPEAVRPGVTGDLAEPEDASDLCHKLAQVLQDEPLRVRMSQQCRAIAVTEYSLDLHVQRYIDLYGKLIEANGHRRRSP